MQIIWTNRKGMQIIWILKLNEMMKSIELITRLAATKFTTSSVSSLGGRVDIFSTNEYI